MIDRTTKLRWRRLLRRGRRHVENIGEQAEQQLEEQFIGRLGRLWQVRRFLVSWFALLTLMIGLLVAQTRSLSQYYQIKQFAPGGIYTEGVVGAFTNANPLYAAGPVDGSISRLIFAGLYKNAPKNGLAAELAESLQVNPRGTEYTVRLKPNLHWHDGQPLTAADVVFTYNMIQNPDAKSALYNSWKGVSVAQIDDRTVSFTLPQALSSFPYSLTNGIVPKHLMDYLPPGQLRSIAFNTTGPIGAGPFRWKTIEVIGNTPETREERIALTANPDYADGKPQLDGFVVRAFHTPDALIRSFRRRELNGAAGLNNVPADVARDYGGAQAYSLPLSSETMVFFKTTNEVLADVRVRRALVQATDTRTILQQIGYPVQAVREPLLKMHLGFDPAMRQPVYDVEAAKKSLEEAGWRANEAGWRNKNGKPLTFRVFTENTPEYTYVADRLKKYWTAAGVQAEFVPPMTSTDLQQIISQHNYDVLLYGISIGPDPDVFPYWHSSQANILSANRLNFSEYQSGKADRALEAGRSRGEAALRAVKYHPFLEAWRDDVPAMGLYQPRFLYLTREPIGGFSDQTIHSGIDRYMQVEKWQIRQELKDILPG